MKKLTICAAGLATLLLGMTASADSIVETWTCKTDEGKTIDDVHAANKKWLEFVNPRIDGEVNSSVATAVVGDVTEFLFADTFPDLATWAAVKDLLDTEEGQALTESLEDVWECSGNRLWKSTPTE